MLATPPWRRAPLLLLRTPGTALAVAGAGAVVAFVAASWPLFLGSVVAASQERQIEERCPWEMGATVTPTGPTTVGPAGTPQPPDLRTSVEAVARATPGLGPPVRTAATSVDLVTGDGAARTVQLVARTGAARHVSPAGGPPADGALLLPDTTYEELVLAPGSPVTLRAGLRTTELAVAGAYERLVDPLPAYWCSQRDRFVPDGYGGDPPPPVVLVDQAVLEDVVETLAVPSTEVWELPAAGALDLQGAGALAERIEGLEGRIEDHLVGRLPAAERPAGPIDAVRSVTSTLPFVVRQSEVVAEGLESGLAPTVAGAAVAGALLLLATGWFWSERRGGELAVLRRLGTGPAAIGSKALLELLLPALAGAVLGLVVAVGVVTVVGPGGPPDRATVGRAAWWIAVAGVAGWLGAGVVAGVRSAVADRGGGAAVPGSRRSWWRRASTVPWEVGVLVVAGSGGGGGALAAGRGRLDLDAVAFVLPIVVIGAVGVLVSRVLRLALALSSGRGERLPVAAWLGIRRLAGRPGAPALFAACVVTAVGVLVYANGASSSLQRSLEDKATLAVGADALVRTVGVGSVPGGVDGVSPFGVVEGPQRSDPPVTLLGVDTATAAGVVRFPGTSHARLVALLDALDAPSTDRVPAVVVGGPAPEGDVVTLATNQRPSLALDVVARLDAFPGMSQSRTTVVIALDRLRSLGVPLTENLWVRGDAGPVVDRLVDAGIDVRSVRLPGQALETATFLAVVWTFGFVRALAVLGGTVAAVGLLVYLDARQRARQLAYGLSRHMGLARATHRWSIVLELAWIVVPAAVAGVVTGLATTRALVPRLDPLPRFEPPTGAVVPWPVVAGAGAVAVLLCVAGALVGQRAADRVRLSTALRHGG